MPKLENIETFLKWADEEEEAKPRDRGKGKAYKSPGIEVAPPRHPLLRPYSSTVGRIPGSILKGLLLHRPDLPFRRWTDERVESMKDVAKDFEDEFDIEDSGILLSLGSSRPFRNIGRTWSRKDLSLPGRLLGTASAPLTELVTTLTRGDHYNPYANTATIFDPEPRLARHELGHATDFQSRQLKTPYSMGYSMLPLFKLLPEYTANQIAVESLGEDATEEEKEEVRSMLRRSYGSYMGGEPTKYVAPALAGVGSVAGPALNRAVGTQDYEMSSKQRKALMEGLAEQEKDIREEPTWKHLLGIA